MNKYRDKLNFEINKAVAEELIKSGFIFGVKYHDRHILVTDKYANNYLFAPCNNPADAMPIIIENKICLTVGDSDDIWVADTTRSLESSFNENPLRAAMEVFLMMKDAENEKV